MCVCSVQSLKAPELKDRLEESEKLIHEMTVTWEDKLRKTEEVAQVTTTQPLFLGIPLHFWIVHINMLNLLAWRNPTPLNYF